MNRYSTFIQG